MASDQLVNNLTELLSKLPTVIKADVEAMHRTLKQRVLEVDAYARHPPSSARNRRCWHETNPGCPTGAASTSRCAGKRVASQA